MYSSTEKAENSYLAGPSTRGADAAVDQMGLVSPAAKTAARKRTSSNGMLVTLRTRHVHRYLWACCVRHHAASAGTSASERDPACTAVRTVRCTRRAAAARAVASRLQLSEAPVATSPL